MLLAGACRSADGQEQRAAKARGEEVSGDEGRSAGSEDPAPHDAGASPEPAEAPASFGWPEALPEEIEVTPPRRDKPIVVYLDAGHGAKDNPGNTSSFCVEEQDFTRSLALDVVRDLEEIGSMKVVPSRVGKELVSYGDRVEGARRAGADVFVSLHSDIRGKPDEWNPNGGSAICRRSLEAPGFAVLYSDEGASALAERRKDFADAIASALLEAKFIPYLGGEYVDLYEPIPSPTGVYVDRHEDRKRIFVLRRTTMPAVIVETHNALDPREAMAFEDPLVRRRFSLALAKGIFAVVR